MGAILLLWTNPMRFTQFPVAILLFFLYIIHCIVLISHWTLSEQNKNKSSQIYK